MRPALVLALIPALALSALVVTAPAAATGIMPATAAAGSEWERISGPDRYATAVAVAGRYAAGVGVVYVAAGANFPDALSAAPAAAAQGGPLLLTPQDVLPASVRAEITRLRPAHIVVAGGPTVVSAAVYDQLALIAPTRRDAGANRYETSRIINQNAFGAGAKTAFIATGANFPDALSASAVAGGVAKPVVLVDGAATGLNAATRDLLGALGVTAAVIAGGSPSVSTGIERDLGALLGSASVTRLSGADRYATSAAVNRASFTSAPTAYFAAGTGFADGLAGAALAARDHAPLYVVPNNCIPAYMLADLQTLGTTRRILLGGASVLGAGIENLASCTAAEPPAATPTPTPAPTPAGSVAAPATALPLHTNVVATSFWVGEIFNASLADGSQVCSTYDSKWALRHTGRTIGLSIDTGCGGSPVGGCDGPSSGTTLTTFTCSTEPRTAANGYFPTTQPRPLENPFYLDLPFDDVNDPIAFAQRCAVVPWAASVGAGRCADSAFSYLKNHWVQITGPNGHVCYGQVEDAGPSSGSLYHDAAYVFGSANARPVNRKFSGDSSQGAGMDVSPALNGCLGFADLDGDTDHVDWRFVDRANVPAGPWLLVETTSQVAG
ncbi:putative cell wall-binding protein [Cryobacterium sp. MP_M5]|uniref:cell wall-binding repeat-containing protein n=1 Tax=unclassified Cryobacterium TaxID=2649013 RepID=UPI0018CB23A7|nr:MULTISPECIES: cell wall-binding repeat-containing protein [unclassified Cryobacterium]MBG6056934.1 putative cell wall-binding protein [Cryobacterium sp. MP_M3]MEC5175133.1 putative cell wall-binding protein [Cryobacterium sp. MP_M5]